MYSRSLYGLAVSGNAPSIFKTCNRWGVPYIAVIGNNSSMNQIRYGQIAKYGDQRGNVGNKLGDGAAALIAQTKQAQAPQPPPLPTPSPAPPAANGSR